MTVEIRLIGRDEPAIWQDEKPARPSYSEYTYRVLASGVLCVYCTVEHVDEQGYTSNRGAYLEVAYGPHAWEQVTGDGGPDA
ncbi:hypothetical protein ABZ904_08650 [Streptomyces sp. NPDC046900]|uniref:hypothetical protein n=1 Tax=Streptomyces sp. NPDC046900 TaxID=3155473 RepID=UPI003406E46E